MTGNTETAELAGSVGVAATALEADPPLLGVARADALRAGCGGDAFVPRSRAAIRRLARRIQRGLPSQAEARAPLVAAAVRRVVEVARAGQGPPATQVAALLQEGLPEPLVVAARLALVETQAPPDPRCPNPWFGLASLALTAGEGAPAALARRGVSPAVAARLLPVTDALRAGPDRAGALLALSARPGAPADALLLLGAHLASLEAQGPVPAEPLGLGEEAPLLLDSAPELPPPAEAGLTIEPASEPCLPVAEPAPRTRRRRRSTARLRHRASQGGGAGLAVGLMIAAAGALVVLLLVLARAA